MTQAAFPARTAFTASGLRSQAKPITRPKIELLNPGWLCMFAALGLSVLGILAIATTEPEYARKQIAFLCVSFVAAAIVAGPHFRLLQRMWLPLLIAVLGLLVFVLIPFVPEAIVRPRNGARRWINIIVTDFQPSELAKIAYIVALASYIRFRRNHRRLLGLLAPFALTFVPMLLILIEPDLGTAMLFLPTLFAMLIAAGAKLRHLTLIIVLGLSAAPMMYPILRPHQKARIHALYYQIQGDDRFQQSIGYQGAKARMLVGAGEISGAGAERARDLVTLNRLPEEHNDMVFAVITCRWGVFGAVAIWGLFSLLVLGGLITAALCKDPFGRLVAVGIVAMLFAQMVINTGMTIGVLPITGMTLPFVSYGGSSLVSAWLMVGLLFNVALRRPQFLSRESFDFEEDVDRVS